MAGATPLCMGINTLAEGEGFEPSCPVKDAWFSRPASLATPAPLQIPIIITENI